jgi:mRNA-degrading endonuclease toxin of MazEF toxin-antitoxin module
MPRECVANLDDILTVPKSLLEERITSLSPDKLAAVSEAVRFSLDLD